MRCQYIVVAESFALDQASGRISLFHLLDKVAIPSTPFFIPFVNLIGLFSQDDPNELAVPCDLRVLINKKVLFHQPQNVIFNPPAKMNRFIVQMQGIMVPEAGCLNFEMSKDEEVLGYWNTDVEYVSQPRIKSPMQGMSSQTTAGSRPSANTPSKRVKTARPKPPPPRQDT